VFVNVAVHLAKGARKLLSDLARKSNPDSRLLSSQSETYPRQVIRGRLCLGLEETKSAIIRYPFSSSAREIGVAVLARIR